MTPSAFIAKWRRVALTERSAAQQHFLDLCDLVDHPKPAEADPAGEWFTFERGAAKHGGGEGWADVWKRGFFGWEYKGKKKDLAAAYDQLLLYRADLENPPLLVVCDMDRILVHTNFTNARHVLYDLLLEELDTPRSLEILRAVFHDPERLRPGATSEAITQKAAVHIAEIAQSLRGRGIEPHAVARFLDRIVFALFAEDIRLLPEMVFTRLLETGRKDAKVFARLVGELFERMATGGYFGLEEIRHFNGGLFESGGTVPELQAREIETLAAASRLDWSAVDPSIFGTLFERGLDPDKRSQLGAHYTSREDIETLVEPVVMAPLRREWDEARTVAENLLTTGTKRPSSSSGAPNAQRLTPNALRKARGEADALLHRFLERLARVKVLDPACGSGNFLYVTLQKLKDLEKEVIDFALHRGFSAYLPAVGPWQLYGIEINPYAFELAQLTVWIGYLQWVRANGYGVQQDPVLRPMDTFRCMDAILDLSDPEHPREPEWPRVDYIVGNPPFLGDKLMRGQLGHEYVESLRRTWSGRVPGGADLCAYWFEKARGQVERGGCRRAGLLATQGIRGGANREVLRRIKDTGDIFFAESDRPWVLDGANVHVSMAGFDDGSEDRRQLDGSPAAQIHSNLTAAADVTQAKPLKANANLSFLGSCKGGPFDLSEAEALTILHAAGNPNVRPNSDLLRPVANSEDLLHRTAPRWIVDTSDLLVEDAAQYEAAFRIVQTRVRPLREKNRDTWLRTNWWRPQRMRPEMRRSVLGFARFLVTTTTSKHRLFVWMSAPTLPDHQLIVFARDDDFFFGVLHSGLHEVWALRLGTRLETRPRYTPTTCFETFPFPDSTREREAAIAEAARELDRLRTNWLNPPEWVREEVLEFPGSIDGPWARYLHEPDGRGIGTVRYPRLTARDGECAARLKERTLTNLYNARPAWLANAHRRLDEAVFAAYGWPADLGEEEVLGRLLTLNLERASR